MTHIKFQTPSKRFFESKSVFPNFNGVLDNILKMDYAYGENQTSVNVSENETSYQLAYLVPGFKKEDIKISLEKNVLHVTAETTVESNVEEKRFTRKEFALNAFKRSFTMPENANLEALSAKHDLGILTITVPKVVENKHEITKEITID